MSSSLDNTASDAIELLEARLQQVRYVIAGHNSESAVKEGRKPAYGRLEDLEHGLDQLISKSKVIQDLLRLRKSLSASNIELQLISCRCSLSRLIFLQREISGSLEPRYTGQVVYRSRSGKPISSSSITSYLYQ